jgi:hypothetical protein
VEGNYKDIFKEENIKKNVYFEYFEYCQPKKLLVRWFGGSCHWVRQFLPCLGNFYIFFAYPQKVRLIWKRGGGFSD